MKIEKPPLHLAQQTEEAYEGHQSLDVTSPLSDKYLRARSDKETVREMHGFQILSPTRTGFARKQFRLSNRITQTPYFQAITVSNGTQPLDNECVLIGEHTRLDLFR